MFVNPFTYRERERPVLRCGCSEQRRREDPTCDRQPGVEIGRREEPDLGGLSGRLGVGGFGPLVFRGFLFFKRCDVLPPRLCLSEPIGFRPLADRYDRVLSCLGPLLDRWIPRNQPLLIGIVDDHPVGGAERARVVVHRRERGHVDIVCDGAPNTETQINRLHR